MATATNPLFLQAFDRSSSVFSLDKILAAHSGLMTRAYVGVARAVRGPRARYQDKNIGGRQLHLRQKLQTPAKFKNVFPLDAYGVKRRLPSPKHDETNHSTGCSIKDAYHHIRGSYSHRDVCFTGCFKQFMSVCFQFQWL